MPDVLPEPADAIAFAVALAAAIIGYVFALVVHELAHWLVARAVRFDVIEVRIGAGPCLWARWLGPVLLELRKWPVMGVVYAHYRRREWLRLRIALFLIAGPVASLALALGLQEMAARCDVESSAWTAWTAATWMAWWTLVISLLPPAAVTGLRSDLQNLSRVMRMSSQQADAVAADAATQECDIALRRAFFRGECERAATLVNSLVAERPEDREVLAFAALVRLAQGDAESALTMHRASEAATDAQSAADRPAAASPPIATHRLVARRAAEINRVFFLVHVDTPEALAEADRISASWLCQRSAARHLHVAMQRTRGLVLVHTSRIETGICALREAMRGAEPAWLRALGMAYLAHAHALRGEAALARRWLRRARRLDRHGPLLAMRQRLMPR